MKKILATALVIGALSFTSSPAFAVSGDFSGNCQKLSPGVTECNDVLDHLTNGYPVKSAMTVAYPAPTASPNTVNGTPPASMQASPAPTAEAVKPSSDLAQTGADPSLFIWAGVGLLALLIGIGTVIRVRRQKV